MRAVFAVLALSVSLSPAVAMDLPNLWFPEEFTGAPDKPTAPTTEPVVVKR
jgi:hypothetical protein